MVMKLQRRGQALQANSKVAKAVLSSSTCISRKQISNLGQKGKSQSSFGWCWSSYIACVDPDTPWKIPIRKQDPLTQGCAVALEGGTSSTTKVRAPSPTPFGRHLGFAIPKSSSFPSLTLEGQRPSVHNCSCCPYTPAAVAEPGGFSTGLFLLTVMTHSSLH